MSVEHFLPGSLEGYVDLEIRAEQYLPEIMQDFDERIDKGEPLVDSVFELQNLETAIASDMLSVVLLEYEDMDAKMASYKALHFAYLLKEQITWDNAPLRVREYLQQLPEEFPGQVVLADTQRYFQHRPALDTLTGHYMNYLDPTRKFVHVCEAVSAFTLMQLDIAARELFIDTCVEGEAAQVDWESLSVANFM